MPTIYWIFDSHHAVVVADHSTDALFLGDRIPNFIERRGDAVGAAGYFIQVAVFAIGRGDCRPAAIDLVSTITADGCVGGGDVEQRSTEHSRCHQR